MCTCAAGYQGPEHNGGGAAVPYVLQPFQHSQHLPAPLALHLPAKAWGVNGQPQAPNAVP